MESTHRDEPGPVRGDRPVRRPAREPLPEDTARLAATGGAAGLTPGAAAALQRAVGNAAFTAAVQRDTHVHGAGCGHAPGDGRTVQRSSVPDVLRSAGRPLEDSVRADMESRLGADFSDVRVHTDAAAKASAAEVGARAYTSGSHVVIGEGGGDRHTLAHELTHVIQQRRGPVAGTDDGSGLKVSDPSDRFEREAEANASRAMSGRPGRTGPVQRAVPAGRAGEQTVQRFHDPAGGAADARDYVAANWARILRSYAALQEVRDSVEGSNGPVNKLLGALLTGNPAWVESFGTGSAMARGFRQVANTETVGDPQVSALVSCLNVMEQEVATRQTSALQDHAQPLRETLVGTEFTFTDAVLNGTGSTTGAPLQVDTTGLKGVPLARARSTITYALTKMNAWAAAVVARPLPGTNLQVTVSDFEVKGHPAKRFTYTNPDDNGFSWWWALSLDDACLETQTRPSPIGDFANGGVLNRIIHNHVFGIATSAPLDLFVDNSVHGGGGHISMDASSAFGGSVELFLESVRAWEQGWEAWQTQFGGTRGAPDLENAPWTGSLPDGANLLAGLNTELDALSTQAAAGSTDLAAAVARLQEHVKDFPLHATASQRLRDKVAAHRDDRLHYQGVNLEHMGAATPAHEQRIEFRDIQAQRSYADLMADLMFIGGLVQGVRMDVAVRQNQRLTDRHPPAAA
ncbi:DUF4157 domain-containing protein [Streptomyces sp. NPDC006197]|uniref:eCIS core domain-containing protein n=1 Tax=Streptomyces sp. NPDC006197 TaxID=3156685 RepID=UPI0033B61215